MDLMTVLSLFGGAGGGGGKGKGGKGKRNDPRTMNKLKKIDADRKVWLGGLPHGLTWKDLEKHVEGVVGSKPSISEVMGKGTGVLAFKTAEEATAAIAAVNGTELKGKTLEADVWTQKEKKA